MKEPAPENKVKSLVEDRVPFKDLRSHEEFGLYDFSKGKPYDVYNQNELYQSGENKDYVIRALGGKRYEVILDVETNEQLIKRALEIKKDYADLEAEFGIPTAPTTFAPSKSITGFPEIWAITEKVNGLNLEKMTAEEIDESKEKLLPIFVVHFENLLKYVETKFAQRKKFMADIFINEQYVYGKTKNDTEDKLYLVDAEPQYLEIDKMDDDRVWTEHLTMVHNLLQIMEEFQARCQSDSIFAGVKEKFRTVYSNLLASMPSTCDHPYHDNLRKNIEELL